MLSYPESRLGSVLFRPGRPDRYQPVVSLSVSFATSPEGCKQRGWHVANVWCKTKRSREAVEALALLLAVLQNSLAKVRVCFPALANPIQRIHFGRVPQKCCGPKRSRNGALVNSISRFPAIHTELAA